MSANPWDEMGQKDKPDIKLWDKPIRPTLCRQKCKTGQNGSD